MGQTKMSDTSILDRPTYKDWCRPCGQYVEIREALDIRNPGEIRNTCPTGHVAIINLDGYLEGHEGVG